MLNAETLANTSNYGGKTEGLWNFNKGSLYAGADIRVERAEGIRSREFLMGMNAGKTVEDNAWQNGKITKTGLFAEYHLHSGEYQFVLSTRLELNNSDIADPSPEFTNVHNNTEITQINPNISLGGYRRFGDEIKLGLWFGRAQRSGGLTERFINYFPVGQDSYELLGDPEIKPEVNNQVDLSFEWKTQGTTLQADVFASYLQDNISSAIDTNLNARMPMSPGVRQFVNIDEAFKTGFEINWIQDLVVGVQHQFTLAYTRAQDLVREEPLPEIAPLEIQYILLGNYFDNKLHPQIAFRHVEKQSRVSSEYGELRTPSFSLVDVGVSYHVSKFRVSINLNNVFDKNYFEHLNRPLRGTTTPIYSLGRHVVASFSLSF
jgi:iron complex outermembrane receptor protein